MKDDLARAIIGYVDDAVASMPVAIPAVVEKYYPAKQCADIRLLLSRKLRGGAYDDPRKFVLPEIPVQQFAAADDCYLYLPVEKGTTGTLLTMDCDLWAWVLGKSDDTRKTYSDRTHDLSDSVFLPGVRRQAAAVKPADSENVELRNDKMRVTLHPDGKIEIAGATKEVVAAISSFMGKAISVFSGIVNDTLAVTNAVPAVPGAVTAIHVAALATWAADQAALQGYKTDLDTMKV